MNITQKIAISATAVAAVTVVAAVSMKNMSTEVVERFPEIDTKIARKAYRTMMLKAFTNQYANIDIQSYNVEQMDELFLAEVRNLI